jgi:ATP-dependent Clp protease protease subunit
MIKTAIRPIQQQRKESMKNLLHLLASNRRQATPRAIETQGDETTLYIYDAIVSDDVTADWCGGVSAQTLVPLIRGVKGGTLHIRISSPGGDVFAAQAIVAAMRDTGAKVIAHIDGFAASAATVIATAADEVEISDGALYMIHCAWSVAYGNATDMRDSATLLDKVDGTIVAQYAKRTGMAAEAVKALMDAETWMTAQEAVDAKFCDRIAEGAPTPESKWDLSAYAKAPMASKPAAEIPSTSTPTSTADEQLLITEEHRERQLQRMSFMTRKQIR